MVLVIAALFILSGCARNTDANGITLPEKVIYLTTPFKDMMKEGFLTAVLVWPLAQAINLFYKWIGSSTLAIILVTVIYNILILPMSIKTTASTQKMQMLQPELTKIQAKYEGRTDDAARMAQAQEMQALYNKYGVNPLGSLITPLLQFPILICMYYAVQRADAVCNGTIAGLPMSTTPADAAKSLKTGWPIVIIFAMMLIFQVLSVKVPTWLAERARKNKKGYKAYADNGNANSTQNNMMLLTTSLMVGLLGFKWPVAMSLYWLLNSVINVVKTAMIQQRFNKDE